MEREDLRHQQEIMERRIQQKRAKERSGPDERVEPNPGERVEPKTWEAPESTFVEVYIQNARGITTARVQVKTDNYTENLRRELKSLRREYSPSHMSIQSGAGSRISVEGFFGSTSWWKD